MISDALLVIFSRSQAAEIFCVWSEVTHFESLTYSIYNFWNDFTSYLNISMK